MSDDDDAPYIRPDLAGKLAIGTIVSQRQDPHPPIYRRILKAYPSGYDWEYTDVPGKVFCSEHSMDPYFEMWKVEEPND